MAFSTFFQQNIVLFLAGIGLLIFLLILEWKKLKTKETTISPAILSQTVNRGATLIDLRKKEDYQAGHIAGAVNIALDDIDDRIDSIIKKNKKDKAIVVYCYKGISSKSALAELKKQGFTNVMQLGGGMGTWFSEGLPVAKS